MVSGNATMAARSITYSPLPKRLEALQRSASVLPNNLAVQRDSKREVCGYAVAHRSEVVIVRWGETGACKQTVIEPFPRSDELDSLTFVTGVSSFSSPSFSLSYMMFYGSGIQYFIIITLTTNQSCFMFVFSDEMVQATRF